MVAVGGGSAGSVVAGEILLPGEVGEVSAAKRSSSFSFSSGSESEDDVVLVVVANWLTAVLMSRGFGVGRAVELGRFRFRGGGGGGGRGGFALPLPIIRNPPATWMLSSMSSASASALGSGSMEDKAFWISRSSCSLRRLFHFPVESLPSKRKRFLGFFFFGVGVGAAASAAVAVAEEGEEGEESGEDGAAVVGVAVLQASPMGVSVPPKARSRRRMLAGGEGVREIGGRRWYVDIRTAGAAAASTRRRAGSNGGGVSGRTVGGQ